jgi:ABC-type polysaccharide/polyol phosphate export permease
MTTTASPTVRSASVRPVPDVPARVPYRTAFATLAKRRVALSAHTPREILVPLTTPILFACVIAPALAKSIGAFGGLDYTSYVAIGTVGLLVPLSCMFAGIGVISDREHGARQDLLAAPIPRSMMVFGNLVVALAVSGLQVLALFGAALLRGSHFHFHATGLAWFVPAVLGLGVIMYGMAEMLANKMPSQEEYIGAAPAIALVPWFFAGAFFRINSMPSALTVFAKILPLTHALAVMRYGLLDKHGSGLHDIWGMHNTTAMAALSLTVVATYAVLLTLVSIRVFTRAAVK